MKTKQTISLISESDYKTRNIARGIVKGNYRLLLCDRNLQQAADIVTEIKAEHPDADIEAIGCRMQSSWEGDIVLLVMPEDDKKAIAEEIRDWVNQKIVVSFSEIRTEQGYEQLRIPESPEVLELQEVLPNSKLIKVYNTEATDEVSAFLMAGQKAMAYLKGSDDEALQEVVDLIETVGFRPVLPLRSAI